MRSRPPTLTATDHDQLTAYVSDQVVASIADHESLAMLRSVLCEARVVPDSQIEPDVVTLDSECLLRDAETGELERYTLVFPSEANIARSRLSVLAPLGSSLLGQPVGATIRVPCPAGVRAVTIEAVPYQPEAEEARLRLSDPVVTDGHRELSA